MFFEMTKASSSGTQGRIVPGIVRRFGGYIPVPCNTQGRHKGPFDYAHDGRAGCAGILSRKLPAADGNTISGQAWSLLVAYILN
jgi:hypothetical protein